MSNASWFNINAFGCSVRVCAEIGRCLLILSAVSLMTMPITEHIWTWDHYLAGGQDFEFGALVILMTLCLVLLLAWNCRRSVDLYFGIWRLFSFTCGDCILARTTPCETIPAFLDQRALCPVSGVYLPPLQI